MLALGFLILVGAAVVALVFGRPVVWLGLLILGSADIAWVAGMPVAAFGFLILGGIAASLIVGRPINRVHTGRALAAHLVIRFGAALFFAIVTFRAARYGAGHYGLFAVPWLGALALLSFASGCALLWWFALADSGPRLCRVGVHRWTDIWSHAGSHRACGRCGVRATAKRRAVWSAALLGAFTLALVTPVAALAVGVYVATRLPPNYSLARSTACWRAHGYRVSRPQRDHAFRYIEIRGHHDDESATFAPSQADAWSWANNDSDTTYEAYNPDYGSPSTPVRNVVFGVYGTFHDRPILACLRTVQN